MTAGSTVLYEKRRRASPEMPITEGVTTINANMGMDYGAATSPREELSSYFHAEDYRSPDVATKSSRYGLCDCVLWTRTKRIVVACVILGIISLIVLIAVLAAPRAKDTVKGSAQAAALKSGEGCQDAKRMSRCGDNECIPKEYVCDGEIDCEQGEDEDVKMCTKENRCPELSFRCASTYECIPKLKVCDGSAQCADWSDERNCIRLNKSSGLTEIQKNGQWYLLSSENVNDRIANTLCRAMGFRELEWWRENSNVDKTQDHCASIPPKTAPEEIIRAAKLLSSKKFCKFGYIQLKCNIIPADGCGTFGNFTGPPIPIQWYDQAPGGTADMNDDNGPDQPDDGVQNDGPDTDEPDAPDDRPPPDTWGGAQTADTRVPYGQLPNGKGGDREANPGVTPAQPESKNKNVLPNTPSSGANNQEAGVDQPEFVQMSQQDWEQLRFPWVAQLFKNRTWACEAMIINAEWLAVPATCVPERIKLGLYGVKVGRLTSKDVPIKLDVTKIVRHPLTQLIGAGKDKIVQANIALLQVQRFDFGISASPICVSNPGYIPHSVCYVTGFLENSEDSLGRLTHLKVKRYNNTECKMLLDSKNIVQELGEDKMCVELPTLGRDICMKSVGSPISCYDRDLDHWLYSGQLTQDLGCKGPLSLGTTHRYFTDWIDAVTEPAKVLSVICYNPYREFEVRWNRGNRRGELYADIRSATHASEWHTIYNLSSSVGQMLADQFLDISENVTWSPMQRQSNITSSRKAVLACADQGKEGLCMCNVTWHLGRTTDTPPYAPTFTVQSSDRLVNVEEGIANDDTQEHDILNLEPEAELPPPEYVLYNSTSAQGPFDRYPEGSDIGQDQGPPNQFPEGPDNGQDQPGPDDTTDDSGNQAPPPTGEGSDVNNPDRLPIGNAGQPSGPNSGGILRNNSGNGVAITSMPTRAPPSAVTIQTTVKPQRATLSTKSPVTTTAK